MNNAQMITNGYYSHTNTYMLYIVLLYTIVYCCWPGWFTIVACHSGNCSMMSWRLSALWCSHTDWDWAHCSLGLGRGLGFRSELCAMQRSLRWTEADVQLPIQSTNIMSMIWALFPITIPSNGVGDPWVIMPLSFGAATSQIHQSETST